jgi:7SK snRNA methylphosphate capping enzyme
MEDQGIDMKEAPTEKGKEEDSSSHAKRKHEEDPQANPEGKKQKKADEIQKRKRNNKPLFIYGNYNHYYGYRGKVKDSVKPRLWQLRKEWFQSKKCLDIGCNVGNFTDAIAKHLRPSSILGIDIDESLIKKAEEMKAQRKKQKEQAEAFKIQNPWPISFVQTMGPLPDYDASPYPENLSYVAGNYLDFEDTQKYDCITCFSTTKWIHFNWGDEGVKKLFQKIYDSLNEGGVFVLEPQLWDSYKKKKTLTEAIKRNVNDIKLKPEEFPKYLTTEMKFTLEKTMYIHDAEDNSSFADRPIYMLRKNA